MPPLCQKLRQWGLGPGDVVAIISTNDLVFPLAFHGVLAAGGIITTINPAYTANEIAYQLKDSRAPLVLSSPETESVVHQASPTIEVFTISSNQTPPVTGLMLPEGENPVRFKATPETLAALPYSSGTTGLAKGVELTHRNLIANILQIKSNQKIIEDDRVAGVLPFLSHLWSHLDHEFQFASGSNDRLFRQIQGSIVR